MSMDPAKVVVEGLSTLESWKVYRIGVALLLMLGFSVTALLAAPGDTTMVSVSSSGVPGYNPNGDRYSGWAAISRDGRYVAFRSGATNLVDNDTNESQDIFINDRQEHGTVRVSVSSNGSEANQPSFRPDISDDGRYVAFNSSASNLVAGDTNSQQDIFVHDRQDRHTTRVNVSNDGLQANSSSSGPSISADGRYVAFASFASNLVANDTNGTADVFVHDRQEHRTTRVSVSSAGTEANAYSEDVAISADGRFIAFSTPASNLVPDDTNGDADLFVHDRQEHRTIRVSVRSDGLEGNDPSRRPSISADGRYVAFESRATNLVNNVYPGSWDVYVHDLQEHKTTLVNVNLNGRGGNATSEWPSISDDGRYVVFSSSETNLVLGDTNNWADVFVRDLQKGRTVRVNVSSNGEQANHYSIDYPTAISGNGRVVAFNSFASNLVTGTFATWQVYVHELPVDNQPPAIEAGGPYPVEEGSSVILTAVGTDPESGQLAYEWNLDGDGTFELFGPQVTFSAAEQDGPSEHIIHVRVTDEGGLTATDQAVVRIANVAPSATVRVSSPMDEGALIQLSLENVSDPSLTDMAAGFSYAFDCGGGYGSFGAQSQAGCPTSDSGTRLVGGRVRDEDGGEREYRASVTIRNADPVVEAPFFSPVPVLEGDAMVANAAFNDTGTSDAPFSCTVEYGDGSEVQPGVVDGMVCQGPAHTYDDDGTYIIRVTVTDKDGGVGTNASVVTVENVAPQATFTHEPETINEGAEGTLTFSNSYDPGGSDSTAGFWYSFDCAGDGTFEVSAVTEPSYSCRYLDNGLYIARGRIGDKDGSFTDYTSEVTVHNRSPLVGTISAPVEPVPVNTAVNTSASFSDLGALDSHTATWDWDGGTRSVGTVNEVDGTGSVSGSHSYTTPGVYTVKLTVTDKDSASSESVFQYVVVYNPNGGFVTGSGVMDSPVGAYSWEPSLTGKAHFGFVSRYQNGATVPSGNTRFRFNVAQFDFESTSYQWLVVAGARAQFKGEGTINDQGRYGFMLTAVDGQVNGGGGSDKFRIKIWNLVTGAVVYDNQIGASEDATPTTVIGGGSILIHK